MIRLNFAHHPRHHSRRDVTTYTQRVHETILTSTRFHEQIHEQLHKDHYNSMQHPIFLILLQSSNFPGAQPPSTTSTLGFLYLLPRIQSRSSRRSSPLALENLLYHLCPQIITRGRDSCRSHVLACLAVSFRRRNRAGKRHFPVRPRDAAPLFARRGKIVRVADKVGSRVGREGSCSPSA